MSEHTSTASGAGSQQLTLFDGVESALERKRRRRRRREYMRIWVRRHPDRKKARDKAYYHKNRERIRRYGREYCAKNRNVLRPKRQAYGQKNKERRRAYLEKYGKKNAAMISEQKKAWVKRNPEHVKEKYTRYYLENAIAAKKRAKEWREKNPEKARILGLHRTRLRESRKHATLVGDPKEIKAFYIHVRTADVIHCHYCKRPIPKDRREVDHVLPLSRHGTHGIKNLVAACRACNRSKNAKTAEEFAAWLATRAKIKRAQ